MEPISRDTAVDQLERRLRDDILEGRYAVGTLLPAERELAARYGVNRNTLKHAFVRLVQAGLVETRHGVGTRVRDFLRLGSADLLPAMVAAYPGWMDEVFEARQSVGALIAERAATVSSAKDHEALRRQVEIVGAARSVDEAQLADAEFHRVLAVASHNRVYTLLTNSLLNAYLPVRALLADPFRDAASAAARLSPLAEAVCVHDASAARAASESYMTETARMMSAALGSRRP
ncbi:FadR family transcriptional regulator [Streptomyces ficellus]|uniref:FadR family transcriptional regulator n=1 Tax=Streptomyces ficellus TaxID=1977088 RepID=A0A6I6FS27_9ACTN|nr:FadR family transcriptional regulator [Streptomyces ficellus]